MATCNVNDLLADAACFSCLSPGILQIIELQLLCEISSIVSSGDLQEVFPGHYGGGAGPGPAFVPGSNHAIGPDLDAPFPIWVWNPDTQTWS